MALIPWRPRQLWADPFRELEQIQNQMNTLFGFSLGKYFNRDLDLFEGAFIPAIDVYDSKDNVIVKADLPGMDKKDIEVSIDDDLLVIKGEKRQENKIKEDGSMRTERFYGHFHREIGLPSTVDTSKITATYKNGVLELALPKKEDVKQKHFKINVN